MGVATWLIEHDPARRRQRVSSTFVYEGFTAGFRSGIHESIGLGKDTAFGLGLALAIFTPIDEAVLVTSTAMGPAFGWTMSGLGNQGIFFDPRNLDPYSYGARSRIVTQSSIRSSRRSGGPVEAKISRGTKSSRTAAAAAANSKPFWSKGKPKCKKGFRYDFKRKLCVKIK